MGMFDGAFSFGDPNSMALLGMLQGVGQASAASRLPVSFGSVLGSLAGGAMQGSLAGYGARKEELQTKLYEAQAAEAARRAAVLGQFNLDTIFGQQPTAAPAHESQPAGGLAPGNAPGGLAPNNQSLSAIPSSNRTLSPDSVPEIKAAPGVGGGLARAAAQYAQHYGVDPTFYTTAIDAESGFNPLARNPTAVKGEHATGIAQFMPSTAARYGVDPLHVSQSLDGGARYFKDLLQQHGGNYVAAAQSYGTLPKDLSGNLNTKQQRLLQVAQALNAGGTTFTDAGPSGAGAAAAPLPMAVAPGMGALNIDPVALARQRAVLGLGGISGDPLSGFAQLYYGSPQYKAATAAAEKGATLPLDLQYAGPMAGAQAGGRFPYESALKAQEGNQALRNQLAALGLQIGANGQVEQISGFGPANAAIKGAETAGVEGAKLPFDMTKETFRGQVGAAEASNRPQTLSAGQTVNIDPNRVPWPAIPGMSGSGLATGGRAPGAGAGGPITLEGGSPAQQQFESELGQANAKTFFTRRDKALDAATALQNTQYARELIDKGIISGAGANWKLALGKGLQAAGIHLNDDAVANTEAYIAARAQDVGTIVKNFGTASAVSDADREYSAKMAAGEITLTEQSMRKILDILDRGSRNAIGKFNEDASKVPAHLSPYPLTVPLPGARAGNEAALPPKATETKTIGGVTYERRDGQWGVVGGR